VITSFLPYRSCDIEIEVCFLTILTACIFIANLNDVLEISVFSLGCQGAFTIRDQLCFP